MSRAKQASKDAKAGRRKGDRPGLSVKDADLSQIHIRLGFRCADGDVRTAQVYDVFSGRTVTNILAIELPELHGDHKDPTGTRPRLKITVVNPIIGSPSAAAMKELRRREGISQGRQRTPGVAQKRSEAQPRQDADSD